jgi:hypothetical protein
VQLTSLTGALTLGRGLAALSEQRFPASAWLTAGGAWCFQTWFRDPHGPCSTANLTNALALSFAP